MDAEKQWTEKDFKFERKVGEGAFGAVYKARHVSTGETVAVKKLKIQENDRKNFEGIVQEMRILCSIEHKNIVSYKGAFWDSDKRHVFIVMEFLGGGDLNDKVQKTKQARSSMPESKIWSYFIQLLKGLKVLHELKIIHRDIKAANCFLSEDLNTIKLGDMNVSKVTRNNFATTQVGTPLYLSPQIWLGKTYDYKTDIWSLGVLLYEMCTLNYPFMGLNMNQLKQAVTRGKFAPLPGYLNPDFTKLVAAMLQMDPAKRPSVDELLNGPIIASKVNNGMDMTISDMKRMNLRLMDTIKIPQNFKNVNLPKKKKPNPTVLRSNSAANVRPPSAQSPRNALPVNDSCTRVSAQGSRVISGRSLLT
jgi:NIMA (never in mitosis gene a)-related kinase